VQCANQEKNQLFIGNDLKWNSYLPRIIDISKTVTDYQNLFFRRLGVIRTLKIKGKILNLKKNGLKVLEISR
jgi:hypothetical protein